MGRGRCCGYRLLKELGFYSPATGEPAESSEDWIEEGCGQISDLKLVLAPVAQGVRLAGVRLGQRW